MIVAVTGASGFVGRKLVSELIKNHNLIALSRNERQFCDGVTCINVGQFSGNTNLSSVLEGVDVVVHLAAKAHDSTKESLTSLKPFKAVNIDFSVNLIKEAVNSGVKRFIYVSSIGVLGNKNSKPFKCKDSPAPIEPYAQSKLQAEIALKAVADKANIELVIIRPPLVYGPNAPGNFGTLLRLTKLNAPLPFGSIDNKRSFIYLDNLVDFISLCVCSPDAANNTFLVSDKETVSTPELFIKLIKASGKRPKVFRFPTKLLKLILLLIGKQDAYSKLTSSLTVDIVHTTKVLNWKPPISLDDGLQRCFKNQSNK